LSEVLKQIQLLRGGGGVNVFMASLYVVVICVSAGWVDCWMTSNVSLSITYKYHPMPPLLKTDTHHITPPDIVDFSPSPDSAGEFIPLTPIQRESSTGSCRSGPANFDAGAMDSDLIAVELEVAPSTLCVYGALLRNFLHVKVMYRL